MEMMDLKVNPLPAKTWHWVRMNDSDLNIELPDETPHIELRGEGEGLKWQREGVDRRLRYKDEQKKDPGSAAKSPEDKIRDIDWKNMETGMGEEFAALLDDSKSFSLYIPDGYRSDRAAVICVDAPDGSAAGQILIHAGRQSEVPIVVAIRHKVTGNGGAASGCAGSDTGVSGNDTVALQLKFYAEEGAKLELYVAQMLPVQGTGCLNIGGVCEDKARVELTGLLLGSLSDYAGIAVKLEGDESSFCADMGYRVRSSQRLDINYIARHIGKKSDSRMNAWGVLEEDSFKLFRGTIDFARGCPGSKGMEKEDVLLLGEHQTNQTIPLILCHEEDVEGDHGATISRLDEQILFYLGSRGIDAKTAENMIARARIEALISRIPDEEIRSQAALVTGSSENETPGDLSDRGI